MTFFETLTAAINDITEHGYDSQARVDYWVEQIRAAAIAHLVPEHVLAQSLRDTLTTIYKRLVERGHVFRYVPDVSQYNLERIKPHLRGALDRGIMASANLIRRNRVVSIEKTLQRFQGWSTSIPIGGTDAADKVEVKSNIRKALASLPFEERRVIIDQGHKLTSTINQIVAVDAGAIAVEWRSHWKQAGYNYRVDHKERDLKIYAIRGSWALERGLINKGAGYTDEMTTFGEEVYCRCFGRYITTLGALARAEPAMLTQKGQDELARVRKELAA
jgi:hypothetical protein